MDIIINPAYTNYTNVRYYFGRCYPKYTWWGGCYCLLIKDCLVSSAVVTNARQTDAWQANLLNKTYHHDTWVHHATLTSYEDMVIKVVYCGWQMTFNLPLKGYQQRSGQDRGPVSSQNLVHYRTLAASVLGMSTSLFNHITKCLLCVVTTYDMLITLVSSDKTDTRNMPGATTWSTTLTNYYFLYYAWKHYTDVSQNIKQA